MVDAYSLNEAGFITEMSTAAINRAIDRHEIESSRGAPADRSRRLGRAELRTLAVIGTIGRDLTPAGRRKISLAMRQLPADARRVDLGIMEVRLEDIDRRITEKAFRLEALRQLVEPQEDGDPLIRGTCNSVYVIAAFTRGQTVAEIIEDCPSMTPELIAAAAEYAEVYPRSGRPLPTRSFTRMLIDMGRSGVWDVETDEGPIAPRLVP